MPDLALLCDDLAAEQTELDQLVEPLDDAGWETATPAEPWTIRDQIAHLAFFEEQAHSAVTDPAGFAASLQEIAEVGEYMDRSIQKGRALGGPGVLAWWRTSRAEAQDAFRKLEAGTRIAWYGPPMSPASFVTARIMETWAHAQDIHDALGTSRQPTDRLRHVAHLGVLARGFNYTGRGRPLPDQAVRVELEGPSGERWTWNEDATDAVTGKAMDFCLVVTQRRHISDTDLSLQGPLAEEWMTIAQAYAGPPGDGRRPGQFASR